MMAIGSGYCGGGIAGGGVIAGGAGIVAVAEVAKMQAEVAKMSSDTGESGSGEWLALLTEVANAIKEALAHFSDWEKLGVRPGQYALDLVADAAALEVLQAANVAVLSEESGLSEKSELSEESGLSEKSGHPVVIVDPVDGSTNASRRIPYYSTSLCVMQHGAFKVGLVEDLWSGTQWTAVAGAGAWCDGVLLSSAVSSAPSELTLSEALVVCNGTLPSTVKCAQTRTLGSAALDLCGTASGRFDAFIDPQRSLHVWDYAAGVLICQEAGMFVVELGDKPLAVASSDHQAGPLAAANARLGSELIQALSAKLR